MENPEPPSPDAEQDPFENMSHFCTVLVVTLRCGAERLDELRGAVLGACNDHISACSAEEDRVLFEKLLPMMTKIIDDSCVGFAWIGRIIRSNSIAVHDLKHAELALADIIVSTPPAHAEPFRCLPLRLVHTKMCYSMAQFAMSRSMFKSDGTPDASRVIAFLKLLLPFTHMLRFVVTISSEYRISITLTYQSIAVEADVEPRNPMDELGDDAIHVVVVRQIERQLRQQAAPAV